MTETGCCRYCTETTNSLAKLESRSRGFTLLPSRGSYGVFSGLRVRHQHFARFGDCQTRNCTVWFPTKQSMIRALRDPLIQRTYPALWIDYRTIFILHKTSLTPAPAPPSPAITCPGLAAV